MWDSSKLRRVLAVGVATLALTGGVIGGAPTVAAEPVDTVLPIPVAGNRISFMLMTWMHVCQGRVIARTDTETPGVTHFRMEDRCGGVVHWRNLTTGATGDAEVGAPSPPKAVATGSGMLVAVVTMGHTVTFWPGMGTWNVP
ncbi:MAG: hypothetical protein GX610_25110 [Rhodococcus sp.]|mgnify:CR=1 FL=1|nr:hypothetical protein [Rhodococcus sp. (in: high G+C Gram-positive bacteria)]